MRAGAQGLASGTGSSGRSPAGVVGAVCGVQAQDPQAAALSVRARSRGLSRADVVDALLDDRSIVRTWCQRGTFHLLAADDVRWLLALLGPVFVRSGRRRLRQLGLDEDASARGVRVIADAVARHGPLTRAELGGHLRRHGVAVEPGTQAVVHLARRAALEAEVCVGPQRHGTEAYVALRDWVDVGPLSPAKNDELAAVELARRHLAAFGPAGPEDLASWSGLPMARARGAWARLAPELTEVSAHCSGPCHPAAK